MYTIGEVVQRFQSGYSKGIPSKDTRLSPRYIYSAIKNARSELIRQKSNKNQRLSDWIYQTLYCIELEKVSTNISNNGIQTTGSVLRSKKEIPQPIADMDADLFENITTIDGATNLSYTSFTNSGYTKGNKYTSKARQVYIRDRRVYVTNTLALKGITTNGIFEDPLEVYLFNLDNYPDCPECRCKPAWDIEFPLDGNLLHTLMMLARDELIVLFSQMQEDTTNNASDDSDVGRMIHQPQQQTQGQ